MVESPANIRDSLMLSVACVAGAVAAPLVPVIGFPVSAAALAGLFYRDRRIAAFIAMLVAVVATAALWWGDVLIVGPALIAVVYAIWRLKRIDVVTITAVLVPVFAVGFAASEFANAWLLGMTVRQHFLTSAEQVTAAMTASGVEPAQSAQSLVDTMMRFAPAGYVVLAVATVVPTLAAIVWAARRSGAEIRKGLDLASLDLSPHALWLLFGALALLAAGRFAGGSAEWLNTAGVNLMIAAKVVLVFQGFAVLAAGLRAANVGKTGKVIAYAIALVVEGPTWVLSIVGLLDFWLNFRRLEREVPGGPGELGQQRPEA